MGHKPKKSPVFRLVALSLLVFAGPLSGKYHVSLPDCQLGTENLADALICPQPYFHREVVVSVGVIYIHFTVIHFCQIHQSWDPHYV